MNFALILFCLSVLSGILWFLDLFIFAKRRAPSEKNPWWVEWGAGFFPVILTVFLLRSFVIEPFKIPSDSMVPTLVDGDFILVNKFTYGIRLPVIDKKIIPINEPQRGDVMVFRYPVNPAENYIKRVVGLPGDKVSYQNKRLLINDQPIKTETLEKYVYKYHYTEQNSETLGKLPHQVINEIGAPGFVSNADAFPFRENCLYNNAGLICTVPAGHYFMLGDNRDNSRDSRYWGFVPEENIVGKAFFIWLNFSDFKRIGAF